MRSIAILLVASFSLLLFSGCDTGNRKPVEMTAQQKMNFDNLLFVATTYYTPTEAPAKLEEFRISLDKAKQRQPQTLADAWEYLFTLANLTSGNMEVQDEYVASYIHNFPNSKYIPMLLEYYGGILYENGEYMLAAKQYSKILTEFPSFKPSIVKYKNLLTRFELDEIGQAESLALDILKNHPTAKEVPNSYLAAGISAHARGDFPKSIEYLWSHFLSIRKGILEEETLFEGTRIALEDMKKKTTGDQLLDILALRSQFYGSKSDEAFEFASEFINLKLLPKYSRLAYEYSLLMIAYKENSADIDAHISKWEKISEPEMAKRYFALRLDRLFEAEKFLEALRIFKAAKPEYQNFPDSLRIASLCAIHFDFYLEAENYSKKGLFSIPYDIDMQMVAGICRLIGKPAPELIGSNPLSGQKTKLSELKGKVVILDFRIYDGGLKCDEVEFLTAIEKSHKARGVEIMSIVINAGEFEDASLIEDIEKEFRTRKMYWPLLYAGNWGNSEIQNIYSVLEVPFLLMVDKSGNVARYRKYGEYLFDPLEKMIESVD